MLSVRIEDKKKKQNKNFLITCAKGFGMYFFYYHKIISLFRVAFLK